MYIRQVQIKQQFRYELPQTGYKSTEFGYSTNGNETTVGKKLLDTNFFRTVAYNVCQDYNKLKLNSIYTKKNLNEGKPY